MLKVVLQWGEEEGRASSSHAIKKLRVWDQLTIDEWLMFERSMDKGEIEQLRKEARGAISQDLKTKWWTNFANWVCGKRESIKPQKSVGGRRWKKRASNVEFPVPISAAPSFTVSPSLPPIKADPPLLAEEKREGGKPDVSLGRNEEERVKSLVEHLTTLHERSEGNGFGDMWRFLKNLRAKKRELLPPYVMIKGKPERNKNLVELEWRRALGREQKNKRDKKWQRWKEEVEEEVSEEREQKEDSGFWGEQKIEKKEFIKALKHFQKNGSPGVDRITVEMILNAGEGVLDLLICFLEVCWDDEEFPSQFFIDIIVPIFKKGDHYMVDNYRPISLLVTMVKAIQYILFERIKQGLEGEESMVNAPAGTHAYGGCRGRDRLQAVWLIEAVSAIELVDQSNGGEIFIQVQDIKSAFPNLWNEGVNWVLFKKGGISFEDDVTTMTYNMKLREQ